MMTVQNSVILTRRNGTAVAGDRIVSLNSEADMSARTFGGTTTTGTLQDTRAGRRFGSLSFNVTTTRASWWREGCLDQRGQTSLVAASFNTRYGKCGQYPWPPSRIIEELGQMSNTSKSCAVETKYFMSETHASGTNRVNMRRFHSTRSLQRNFSRTYFEYGPELQHTVL